jgi:hypothetical protein
MVHGMSFNFFATRASDMVNCERSFFFFQVGERDFALMCKYEGGADFGWRGRRVARTSGGADVGSREMWFARKYGSRGCRVAILDATVYFALNTPAIFYLVLVKETTNAVAAGTIRIRPPQD